MTTMSKEQASQVALAVREARAGRATLGQLGAAHDLCASAGLPGCLEELRGHMRRMLDVPGSKTSIGRELALHVVSGAATHYLLTWIGA